MAARKNAPPGKSDRGDRFWRLRKARGLNQDEIGHVDRLIISAIERGKNKVTSAPLRDSLAEFFAVPGTRFTAYLEGEIELDALEQKPLATSAEIEVSTAITRTIELEPGNRSEFPNDHRYSEVRERVIAHLTDVLGYKYAEAKWAVNGIIAFKEGPSGVSFDEFLSLALRALAAAKGKALPGVAIKPEAPRTLAAYMKKKGPK